jgi:hypothetical protein
VSQEVVIRIAFLVEHARAELTRGQHRCLLCAADSPSIDNGEIRVVTGDGKLYVAPAMIRHYIDSHHYYPPTEFQTALVSSPRIDPVNTDDLCVSCGSKMTVEAVYDDLVRASDRRPVVVTYYNCPSCDVSYKRVHLR